MKIKKSWVISFIASFLLVSGGVISYYYGYNNLSYFLAGTGFLIIFLPFVIASIIEGRIERDKDEMFLEFSRNLVGSVESGTPISKSIINMRGKNFGSLTPYVEKLANQIELGIPIQKALETFAYDTKSRTILRAITLIREADKTGGDISTILESVANSVSEIEKLREERRSAISSIVVEGYIIFLVFIIIMVVLELFLLPKIFSVQFVSAGKTLSTGVSNNFIENQQVTSDILTPEDFSFAFLALLLFQGFFAGLVIGKLSEGKIKSGIKHSFIMIALAILISNGSRLIIK
ncbi:MAG: type II secretion system F family protein [Candidatus Pacearchaeota archaeon]